MLFPTSGWVYVWKTPKEAHNPECLVPTVKYRGGSVMIWAANILVFCWSYNDFEWSNHCQWLCGHFRSVFLNCQATAQYWALASIIPRCERFSWKLSF